MTSDEFKDFPLVKWETFFLKLLVCILNTVTKWVDQDKYLESFFNIILKGVTFQ